MDEEKQKVPKGLHKKVLKALKARYDILKFDADNTLAEFHLLKRYRRELGGNDASSRRQAVNRLLDEGMIEFKRIDELAYALLERRFTDGEQIQAFLDEENGVTKNVIMAKQRTAVQQLTQILWDKEIKYRQTLRTDMRKALPDRSRAELVGVDGLVENIVDFVTDNNVSSPVLLHGLGGIGKTSLAETAVSRLITQLNFAKIIWVHINNSQLLEGRLTMPFLQNAIIEEMAHTDWNSLDEEKKLLQLDYTFKSEAHLVIVDNVECHIEPSVIKQLIEWSGLSRFLVTSRVAVPADSGWTAVSVEQLSFEATAELIKAQARRDGLTQLANLSMAKIRPIYDAIGGNPLAIKLVVGLTKSRPLQMILQDIPKADSKKVEGMYKYIYWEAWKALSDNGRSLLEMMYSADEMGYDAEDLQDFSTLESGDLWEAVDELIERSLMEKSRDLDNPLYSIHRLTASFLKIEITHWPV